MQFTTIPTPQFRRYSPGCLGIHQKSSKIFWRMVADPQVWTPNLYKRKHLQSLYRYKWKNEKSFHKVSSHLSIDHVQKQQIMPKIILRKKHSPTSSWNKNLPINTKQTQIWSKKDHRNQTTCFTQQKTTRRQLYHVNLFCCLFRVFFFYGFYHAIHHHSNHHLLNKYSIFSQPPSQSNLSIDFSPPKKTQQTQQIYYPLGN